MSPHLTRQIALLSILAAGSLFASANQADVIIQPDEAASQDSFIYQFLPTFNLNSSGFGSFLGVSKTASGHDLQSLIQFDLTGVAGLTTNQRAYLNVYVVDAAAGGFPFVNPSSTAPIDVDLYANTSSFNESTVSWNTKPATQAGAAASASISGIDQWFTFDVTDLVGDWIDGSLANNGLTLTQRAAVTNGGGVAALFESSASSHKPYLEIATIPEPASMGLLALGSLMILARRSGFRQGRC